MIGHEASRTALATAYMRAAHQLLDSKPLLLEDTIAVQLLGKDTEQQISAAAERYQAPMARALRSHVVLRSRYAEDQLRAAVERGISQYVIVGAGFDTFSLRQPAWANDLTIVEVDHLSTQTLKRSRIAAAGLNVPANVRFADINFESESLEEGLRRHGIGTTKQTFFSWLGVTMYLTEAAIDSTLQSMVNFPVGSQVALTFSQPTTQSSPAANAAALLAERVESIGEPFISFFEPKEIVAKLITAGFEKVELLSLDEARTRYFFDKHSDLPPPKRIGLVSAIR